jgi:hypothetical protein
VIEVEMPLPLPSLGGMMYSLRGWAAREAEGREVACGRRFPGLMSLLCFTDWLPWRASSRQLLSTRQLQKTIAR